MSAAVPLDYAGRCERYARQRGWAYDEHELSTGHLTPRQLRRAMHKERHEHARRYGHWAAPGDWDGDYGRYNDGGGGIFWDDDWTDDPHDLGYCVTPGCNCSDDDY